MKKLWITLMTVVSVLGFMPAADAASGYVNMEVVLAQLMTPIQEKLKMAIAKAAKEKSVDIVINAREVVYGGVDLTESVKKNMK